MNEFGAVDRVIEYLRSLTATSSSYAYPDTDNQMEDGVFSFAKRTDEISTWSRLVPSGDGRALDAGCGLGAHALALSEKLPRTFLVDADRGRAEAAALRLGWAMGERVFVARVDDGSLEHKDLANAFSFVQLMQVLGHLPLRSTSSTLRAMKHILEPGGVLLCAIPFAGTPMDLFFITALDVDGKVRPRQVDAATFDAVARSPSPKQLPVRHFSMTSVLAAFAAAGLVVEKTEPYHWFSHDTGDVFVVARKP